MLASTGPLVTSLPSSSNLNQKLTKVKVLMSKSVTDTATGAVTITWPVPPENEESTDVAALPLLNMDLGNTPFKSGLTKNIYHVCHSLSIC